MAKKISSTKKNEFDYDMIVIGSGPSGIYCAVQAAKLGKKVVIVEAMPDQIGGSWIHTGTLPSKTLRESLASIHSIRHHVGQKWFERVVQDLDTRLLYGRAQKISNLEEKLVRNHLQNNDIQILKGYGLIESRHSVRVNPLDGEPIVISSKSILIATGSRPRRPKGIPFDGWRIVDSDEVLMLNKLPKRMVIYGAGVIGCEYACIFNAIGTDLTIIDSRSRIMQSMDQDAARELQRCMEADGVKFMLGQDISSLKVEGPRAVYEWGGDVHHTDVFFFAAGRVSRTEHLGLEKHGIETNDRGAIVVGENFQTNIPNIYAAGDAIGPPALAATGMEQGRHVACHAFGVNKAPFPSIYPIGVYTIPELSQVGDTEETLTSKGIDFVVGRANYSEIARGHIRGDSLGLLKLLVCRKTCQILGIHIVGDDACNLVHIGMAFMLKGGQAQDLVNMIFNYPTLAEGYRIAAFNALNQIFPDGNFQDAPSISDLSQNTSSN